MNCTPYILPYCIDWAATGTMLGGLGAIVAACAVIWAAKIARETFEDWTKKERFKYDREQAVAILSTFEEARYALKTIRSPLIYAYETAEAESEISKIQPPPLNLDEERSRYIQAQVTISRISSHSDLWDRIFKLLPLAKVLFSKEVRDNLLEVLTINRDITYAARLYTSVANTNTNALRASEAKFWTDSFEPAGLTTDPIIQRLQIIDLSIGEVKHFQID